MNNTEDNDNLVLRGKAEAKRTALKVLEDLKDEKEAWVKYSLSRKSGVTEFDIDESVYATAQTEEYDRLIALIRYS